MTSAFKLCSKPCINDHLCQFDADDAGTEAQHVSIIVLFGQLCGIGLAADYCTDALHLIGSQ